MPKRYEHKVIYVSVSWKPTGNFLLSGKLIPLPKEQWPELFKLETEGWELVTVTPFNKRRLHDRIVSLLQASSRMNERD